MDEELAGPVQVGVQAHLQLVLRLAKPDELVVLFLEHVEVLDLLLEAGEGGQHLVTGEQSHLGGLLGLVQGLVVEGLEVVAELVPHVPGHLLLPLLKVLSVELEVLVIEEGVLHGGGHVGSLLGGGGSNSRNSSHDL